MLDFNNATQQERFVRLLDKQATAFTFQTFADDKGRTDVAPSVLQAGADSSLLQQHHNNGAGIYITVNETDGHGRKSQNMVRVRAVWREADAPDLPTLPLEPSLVVETSPGHRHEYFLVFDEWPADEQGRADFAGIMDRMVETYGSDKNAKDISRVLRMPGFLNRKYDEAFQVRIHKVSGRRYTRKELLEAFPPIAKRKPDPIPSITASTPDEARIRDALFAINADDRETWLRMGMAIKHELGEGGRGLWDEWSAISDKFDRRDQERTWNSFKRNGVSAGTIFREAALAGWRDPADEQYERLCERLRSNTSPPPDERPAPNGWNFYQGAANPRPIEWIIKKIVPRAGFGILSGQWGTFKTTAALEISLAVMTEVLFANQYRIKRKGAVAYFAAEGAASIEPRLAAIAKERGFEGELPFAWRDNCPALTDPDAAESICRMIKEVEAQLGQPVVLVWIDTIVTAARYETDGADNDTVATQKINNCLAAISKSTSGFVFGIDHFGKVMETGTKGSINKEAGAYTVIAALGERSVSGGVKNTRLALRKQRDGESGFEIPYTAKTVVTGTDDAGDPIAAIVFDWGRAQESVEANTSWTTSLALFRRILTTALVDGGNYLPFTDGPTVRAIDKEIVRQEYYRQRHADGETEKQRHAAKQKAFARDVNTAQAKGLIGCRKVDGVDLVWLATSEAPGRD
jgi:hypothetical protein